jgi:D-glycerate 3-kinase
MARKPLLESSSPQPKLDPALERHLVRPLLGELARLAEGAAGGGRRPVVALNGPVGAGKTTLGRVLLERAEALGVHLAVASIDDFYLPWPARQRALVGNPFGVSRVPPGSHDVTLALAAVQAWRAGGPLCLPRFDKALRAGQGDQAGTVEVAADALLLEGWLLGCQPLGVAPLERALQSGILDGLTPQERAWLPRWDRLLQGYQPLWRQCDQLWLLRPQSWTWPRRWRFQAEAQQRGRGFAWLQPSELNGLVRASLCSLPPALYQDPLISQSKGYALLDRRRRWIGGGVNPGSETDQLSASSPSSSTG